MLEHHVEGSSVITTSCKVVLVNKKVQFLPIDVHVALQNLMAKDVDPTIVKEKIHIWSLV